MLHRIIKFRRCRGQNGDDDPHRNGANTIMNLINNILERRFKMISQSVLVIGEGYVTKVCQKLGGKTSPLFTKCGLM